MTLNKKERDVRAELDKSFKPLFENYELSGGIPYDELRENLRSSKLPRTTIDKFIHKADTNRDQRINYDEFVYQMTLEDPETYRRLKLGQRALNKAVRVVAPRQAQKRLVVTADAVDALNWGEEDVDEFIEAYTCCPPPIFIPLISLAQIAVFIYYAIKLNTDDDKLNDVTASRGCDIESPLIYNPYKRIQAWRFLSYMFIHNGYVHVIFNCFLQLVLGTLLELVHKFWRVGIVYLLGVIAGSLAHSIFDSNSYLAGASGGCYALIGAHFASVIINWTEMQKRWTKTAVNFFSSGVFSLIILILLGGGDTALAIYNRYTAPTQSQRIGYAAHGGGFLAGILIGVPVLRNLQVKNWEKILFWVCLVLYLLFVAAAVLFNAFCGDAKLCPLDDPFKMNP